MRWMRVPESSLKMLAVPALLWANWELASRFVEMPFENPFARLLFISHALPSKDGPVSYIKGYNDLWFLAYWVICFSFIRLFWTVHVFHPMARHYGIRDQGKIIRYGEQGYAVVYFTVMGSFGLYVMSQLPTWYFNCTPQWSDYPQWKMTATLKRYYLLHSAYWLQQFLVLALRLEKPRRDYTELVIHHFVTLWLIGWSYLINLTWIGNLIYMTMDWSDVFLAAAKMCNYLSLKRTSESVFGFFVLVWSYTRHYLNLYLLYSVWTEFDEIPQWAQRWSPEEGVWMVWWMKYQIWTPIFLLQIVNLFWYFRIWRILLRALFSSELADERSDDEDEGEDDTKTQ
ncbi:longevity assurance proteins LAG1/LAC1 [Auricularia subglabra TFB-10046 SS5]|nr:longevity assurance proteins LAG1/LAC1 [Auricularia subglabra TFB-10046 SS5]